MSSKLLLFSLFIHGFQTTLVSNLKPHCFHLDISLKSSSKISNWLSRIPIQSSLVNSELLFFITIQYTIRRDLICYFTNIWLQATPISSVFNICINGRGTYQFVLLPTSFIFIYQHWLRQAYPYFYRHIHKSIQWLLLAQLSCFFCRRLFILLCFLIKLTYFLNMSFAHFLCCCNFVFNNVNYLIKQNPQLDRFLKTLQILTSWILIEVNIEGRIELKTLQEFGL